MSVHGFSYYMFNSKNISPSIEAGYGPYSSIESAIQTIQEIFRDDPTAEAFTTTGYNPPLGLHFGVISSGIFTEYEYKQGEFTLANVGTGIIPTITDVRKGTVSASTTLVNNGIAYIPMVTSDTDGLMAKEDKAKLDKSYSIGSQFIEVYEDGIYNVDSNFGVEPSGVGISVNGGGSSQDINVLIARVNRIIEVLGDLFSEGNDYATFTIEQV